MKQRNYFLNFKNGFLQQQNPDNTYTTYNLFQAYLNDISYTESAYGTTQITFTFVKDDDPHKYLIVGDLYNNAILALLNFLDSVEKYKLITIQTFAKSKNGKILTFINVFNNNDRLAWKRHKPTIPDIIKTKELPDDTKFQQMFKQQFHRIYKKLHKEEQIYSLL